MTPQEYDQEIHIVSQQITIASKPEERKKLEKKLRIGN